MITKEKRQRIKEKLEKSSVDIKSKTVFATRYGLYDGIYKTTDETGRIHGMTGQAVRLIMSKIERLLNI